MKYWWEDGQLKAWSLLSGVSKSKIKNMLKGTYIPSRKVARVLEYTAKDLDINISRLDMLYPTDSDNPLMAVAKEYRIQEGIL